MVALGIICGESVDLQKLGSLFVTKIMIYLRNTLKCQKQNMKTKCDFYFDTLKSYRYSNFAIFEKGSKISPCSLETIQLHYKLFVCFHILHDSVCNCAYT